MQRIRTGAAPGLPARLPATLWTHRGLAITETEAHDLLLSILKEHEPNLGEHVLNVGRRARTLARELGCVGTEVEMIGRAAQLHDIGKIEVPSAILRKPGPLDAEEWRVIRQHTLTGQRILDSIPSLRRVGALVRASHERWDGAGYPDGLRGEAIPLGSRIIFVCDAFDAMTEERPYQAAMTGEVALAELRGNAGSQFDPRVVDAFADAFCASDRVPGLSTSAPGPASKVS